MHPIIFSTGCLSVYSYGAAVAAGFAVACLLAYNRAADFGLDKSRIIDIFIVMLVSGIAGARIFYIFLNPAYYIANPVEMLKLSKGGLVWYGSFAGGLAGGWLYVRLNRISFWTAADLISPYIALAQSIGRIGCFLNGCCFGKEVPADFVFGVRFPHEAVLRHPTQLYSSLAMLLIFILLRLWQERRRFPGEIFLGYCILYSSKRFLTEFLRGDSGGFFRGLTLFQVISAAVFLTALAALTSRVFLWKRRSTG
jgi:phosphatidylglycerol:prolipoprotein diacylglycerol transferase